DSGNGCAPLVIQGPLLPGHHEVSGATSSQFATALLLVLPLLEGDSLLDVRDPVRSEPYLRLTETWAGRYGLRIERTHEGLPPEIAIRYRVPGFQRPQARSLRIPGDWSSAAPLLVGAAASGGRLVVTGLDAEDGQGDRVLVEVLSCFGAKVDWVGDSLQVEGGSLESVGEVDVGPIPDLFPPLAVLAALSRGWTHLVGSPGLRHKESDRITVMARALCAAGIEVVERDDGLSVHGLSGPGPGGRPRGSEHTCEGDHRVHLALVVLGLLSHGVSTVDEPACASISFPDFLGVLRSVAGAA
ncbi:MAG: hypothetical protein QGG40_22210, partial [Myxococcota bacterium]|nr:hypothetical protein [Myxococcota bacterium]